MVQIAQNSMTDKIIEEFLESIGKEKAAEVSQYIRHKGPSDKLAISIINAPFNKYPLDFCTELIRNKTGLILEFGVFQGYTANIIMKIIGYKPGRYYGFDTFTGLPEAWRPGYPKGTFDVNGKVPIIKGAKMFKGLVQNTLVPFISTNSSNIDLIHLDFDLYGPTAYVFDVIGPLIKRGTYIVFDELINYPGYLDHEWKAFKEALLVYGWNYKVICRSGDFVEFPTIEDGRTQKVAIQIV